MRREEAIGGKYLVATCHKVGPRTAKQSSFIKVRVPSAQHTQTGDVLPGCNGDLKEWYVEVVWDNGQWHASIAAPSVYTLEGAMHQVKLAIKANCGMGIYRVVNIRTHDVIPEVLF